MISVFLGTYPFQGVMPCNLVEVDGYFGGTYCLHLQGHSVSQVISQKEVGGNQSSKDGGSMFLQDISELLPDYMELHLRR
jgi:hypothetical protein